MLIRERIQSVLLSNLSRSDGSALYSFGDTVVQTSVFGPTEVHQNKENPINTTVEVVYRRLIRSSIREDPQIKLMERFIVSNISSIMYRRLHPRTLVTVVLQEMQNRGSLMASCLNSVCFALLDSAFPLKYLLASVSAVITTDGHIIVNATNEETDSAAAVFTAVFESNDSKLVSIITDGNYSFPQFQQIVNSCKESAEKIFEFYRNSIQKRFEKDLNHLPNN